MRARLRQPIAPVGPGEGQRLGEVTDRVAQFLAGPLWSIDAPEAAAPPHMARVTENFSDR